MDLITRISGTDAYEDKNNVVYNKEDTNILLNKYKNGYMLRFVDKTHGNDVYAYKINILEGSIEMKSHYYTASNYNVYRKFFTLKEAREFSKRFCKIIGPIKIHKISNKGKDELEVFIYENKEL